MRIAFASAALALALALALPASALSTETLKPTELLDRLTGEWVLTGMIDGQHVTHDVEAEWVLEGGYLRLHELSREKEPSGRPAYEAIVILSWEEVNGEFKCFGASQHIKNKFGTGYELEVKIRTLSEGEIDA